MIPRTREQRDLAAEREPHESDAIRINTRLGG
jgi:hypothetical protein